MLALVSDMRFARTMGLIARMLLKRLADGSTVPAREILPTNFIPRSTTESLRAQ